MTAANLRSAEGFWTSPSRVISSWLQVVEHGFLKQNLIWLPLGPLGLVLLEHSITFDKKPSKTRECSDFTITNWKVKHETTGAYFSNREFTPGFLQQKPGFNLNHQMVGISAKNGLGDLPVYHLLHVSWMKPDKTYQTCRPKPIKMMICLRIIGLCPTIESVWICICSVAKHGKTCLSPWTPTITRSNVFNGANMCAMINLRDRSLGLQRA